MVFLNLLAAITVLLWATRMIRLGVSRFLGVRLAEIITAATSNRFKAFGTGFSVAAMLQSSSATSIITASFAVKGSVSVMMGIAVLLGADVGSTLIVQVLSFNMAWLAPVGFLVGYGIFSNAKSPHYKELGRAVMGFGMTVFALQLIGLSIRPISDGDIMVQVIGLFSDNTALTIIVVAILTWVMHSSISMVLIIIGFATAGTVDMSMAFTMVIGANIGGSLIPVGLTLRKAVVARRIVIGAFLIRVVCGASLLLVMPYSIAIADYLWTDIGVSVALYHTIYNICVAVMGLIGLRIAVWGITTVLPDTITATTLGAKILDLRHLNRPKLALSLADREVIAQAHIVQEMFESLRIALQKNDMTQVEKITENEDKVDALYEDIKLYVTKITVKELAKEDAIHATNTIAYTTNLEHISDIINQNLLHTVRKKISSSVVFSQDGWQELQKLHTLVLNQLQLSIAVYMKGRVEDARLLLMGKQKMEQVESIAMENHFQRLRNGVSHSLRSSALHLDTIRDLKRINAHLCSIAYPILSAHGELYNSRLKGQ